MSIIHVLHVVPELIDILQGQMHPTEPLFKRIHNGHGHLLMFSALHVLLQGSSCICVYFSLMLLQTQNKIVKINLTDLECLPSYLPRCNS